MRPLPRVLLTGFDAFGGETLNPSWEAVRRLRGARLAGHRVVVRLLPTEFARAPGVLFRAIDRHRPALVLCVGQAGGRSAVSVERVALNLVDARIPDNAGARPVDAAVVPGAPAAYLAPLPVRRLVTALRRAGIPAEASLSAGAFVCNAVFYALCHRLAAGRGPALAGFLHIPYLPRQVVDRPKEPSLALETVVAALEVAVEAALGPARAFRRPRRGARSPRREMARARGPTGRAGRRAPPARRTRR